MAGAEFKSSCVRTDPTSPKVDTPRTTDNSAKVESDDKYGTYSPSRLDSKRRITFSSGSDTPDPEKAEVIETVEGVTIDTDRVFGFTISSDEDENV